MITQVLFFLLLEEKFRETQTFEQKLLMFLIEIQRLLSMCGSVDVTGCDM